ncbi:hypothetical protein LOC68_16600 [Blastopirellula sp. JC732]|uniref:Asl1-like glycosyl hydrolase catalytic domain-containing protein n=1 Tax=Blastopirellula sediminis TaxID=2894196 RepID=A0A9X1SH31_9BACT|nr:hypothetical protein [Blastopirellula sediminis]MCC9606689.1 hypothetical protein [Blastopirellula sediminis]MCC9630013.1 hypothetical protein [Blastopirellula sediminis]
MLNTIARPTMFLVVALAASLTIAAPPIVLRPDMLNDLSGRSGQAELVDEQNKLADPAYKPTSKPKANWQGAALYYPRPVVIDLGQMHQLSAIRFYDVEGNGLITIAARVGDKWQELGRDELKKYNAWSEHPLDVECRYLRLTFATPAAAIAEVALEGKPVGAAPEVAKKIEPPQPPPMDKFIGVNGFIDDPVERLAAFGMVREYHNAQWDDGASGEGTGAFPQHAFAYSPSAVRGAGWGWDFDRFYTQLKEAGVEVYPCVQGADKYGASQPFKPQDKPIAADADPTDPASYAAHGAHLFQTAARYGTAKVDESLLTLEKGQEPKSGLGLITAIENWNEPDKWWEGRSAYFNPLELAAMCSADYDGHQGKLGPGVGAKNANPKLPFVLSGLATTELSYLRAMEFWAELHRGGSFPADVINLHHYSNDAGGQDGQPTTGISPEEDRMKERFARIVAFRNEHLPQCELWVSEFGYDIHPKSVQRAPAIGETSAEETQARWLVRSYLALAAAGVDRAQMYMLRDVNGADSTKFSSSGVTSSKDTGHQPRRSWYYIATMKNVLHGLRFEKEIEQEEDVLQYRFSSEDGRQVDLIWLGSSRDQKLADYQLNGIDGQVEVIQLTGDSTSGKVIAKGDAQGLRLEVSESPLLVRKK